MVIDTFIRYEHLPGCVTLHCSRMSVGVPVAMSPPLIRIAVALLGSQNSGWLVVPTIPAYWFEMTSPKLVLKLTPLLVALNVC